MKTFRSVSKKILSAGFALSILCSSASAQEVSDGTVDIIRFRPPPDGFSYFAVPSASTYTHLQLGASIWTFYENDPLSLTDGSTRISPSSVIVSGEAGDAIIDDRFIGNVQTGLGLSKHFSIAFDLPLIFWQQGYQLNRIENPLQAPEPLISSGVGDLKIQPKLVPLDRDKVPIGMALAVPVGMPTGNGGSFLGEEGFSVSPYAVMEFSDGSIRKQEYMIRGSIMGGYHIRNSAVLRNINLENEILYGGAFAFRPVAVAEFIGELRGAVGGPETAQHALEFTAGFKLHPGQFVELNLAGGSGILPGVGSPDYRVVFGVSVAPWLDPNSRDGDRDGIPNSKDQCPSEREDFDGWQDEDGCPEMDNDMDGLSDLLDRCPLDEEDLDNFQDEDGCPDWDNDNDNIQDLSDRCPNEPESKNGYMDEDGCPDAKPINDTDDDGYKDNVDRCPFDAEDFDGFQDEDGCPEVDNDNDGVLDADDKCPLDREVYNGVEDEDGCPDQGRVVIEKDNIKIMDKIYFDLGKSTIKGESSSLLDEIAATIQAHPELLKIRIEGHTDNVGSEITNLKLSQARANSVRAALVQRGVSEDRLDAVGFGEMRPIVSNKTADSRKQNRRVEFIIIDRK